MKKWTFSAAKLLVSGFFLTIWVANLSAQRYQLIITDPEAGRDTFEVRIALFGPATCDLDTLAGPIIEAEDGSGAALACDTVINDLSGRIALIDRGVCEFSQKVFQAQQAGALAALIINPPDREDELINMAPGANADQVTIPSFFLRTQAGNALRALPDQDVRISIERLDIVDDFDGEVVYREDFNGGFNDWVATGLSCNGAEATNAMWTWIPDGVLASDCFDGTLTMPSPTRCNGVVAFHSEFLDNSGDCSNGIGTGVCPAPQLSELRSPAIDLTGSDAVSYSLRFHQLAAQFQSGFFASWSFDGGETWEDTTAINTDLETFDINTRLTARVPLIGSGDADSVVVRFLFAANYYFWMIDDVQIVAQEANNLRVNNNFYAIPPNAQFPLSQAEPIPFLADIENIGALTQPNTTLNVSIVNSSGQTVFDESLPYGNVPGNTLVENVPFGTTFNPQDTGDYFGVYAISSDSMDFDTLDNRRFFSFRVTDNLFAKEFGATTSFPLNPDLWDAGEPHSWATGNHFHVPNGDGQFVQTVSFALGDPVGDAGQTLAISLYEWPEDQNNDGVADRSELNQVGFDIYTISGAEAPLDLITIPYPTIDDPIALKDDMDYLLMLEYFAADEDDVVFATSEGFDYLASIFLSEVQGAPRYSGMFAAEGDLSSANFVPVVEFTPVVRMTIGSEPTTQVRPNPQVLNDQFLVFPNPARAHIQVQFELREQAEQGLLELFDSQGRRVWLEDLGRVHRERRALDLGGLPSGAYQLRLTTERGLGTQRLLITR